MYGSNELFKLTNNKFDYVCDCGKIVNKEDNLYSMKRTFESLASKNKIIYNNDFSKLLEEHHVPKNLINLTIDYLKKYTQKEYFSFNDIKYFFSNLDYSIPLINKKKFIFKIILDIYGSDNK